MRPFGWASVNKKYLLIAVCAAISCAVVWLSDEITQPIINYHQRWGLRERLYARQMQFPWQSEVRFKAYQLNVSLSNRISMFRDIPDHRPVGCYRMTYDVRHLPDVSVIIPFYNEAWSVLLRTINSVYFRTPKSLLREIILVDDSSTFHYLKQPLDDYIAIMPNVTLIRTSRREGLMRTRMTGAEMAKGKVLMFLDAHVEVTNGWLEPLLDAISRKRNLIAIPHVDTIDPHTMEYVDWSPEVHGGFSWTLDYVWKEPPDWVRHMRTKDTDPILTPTTIGCAMAIDRNYFFDLGGFDSGMFIWGGENLEISFRTWTCGGALFIYPCSRVGHIFRQYLPYKFPAEFSGTDVIQQNYQRLAEVWMDNYKDFYYKASKQKPMSRNNSLAVIARKKLRERLKCRPFKWYLDNVTPETFQPWSNATFQGQIKNLRSRGCLTVNSLNGLVYLTVCSKVLQEQYFYLVRESIYHNSSHCMLYYDEGLRILPCEYADSEHRQAWIFTKAEVSDAMKANVWKPEANLRIGLLLNSRNNGSCVSQVTFERHQYATFMHCSSHDSFQYWSFTYHMA